MKSLIEELNDRIKEKIHTHEDHRGVFEMVMHDAKRLIGTDFCQINSSMSHANVFRGLHYQTVNPQGKLIYVTWGKITDYALQLKESEPDFGRLHYFSLKQGDTLYVPPGYAHGFRALVASKLIYLCTTPYEKAFDAGVKISTLMQGCVASERDRSFPEFSKDGAYLDS